MIGDTVFLIPMIQRLQPPGLAAVSAPLGHGLCLRKLLIPQCWNNPTRPSWNNTPLFFFNLIFNSRILGVVSFGLGKDPRALEAGSVGWNPATVLS